MKFTEEHEWLRVEDDWWWLASQSMPARNWAMWCLLSCPKKAPPFPKDDEVVVIESVKAASDILSPLDGEIVEVNPSPDG